MSSSDIVGSLERVPRAGLRSADLPADAPPRSHSQGATPSRLPADTAGPVPRAPTVPFVATEIGSPHRPRGPRTPATPGAARDVADALLQRTQLENSDLRMQLALAQQQAESDRRLADSDRRLADSDRRLLEQQFASDLQIRELGYDSSRATCGFGSRAAAAQLERRRQVHVSTCDDYTD